MLEQKISVSFHSYLITGSAGGEHQPFSITTRILAINAPQSLSLDFSEKPSPTLKGLVTSTLICVLLK